MVRAISIYISREVGNWSKAEQEKLEAWKQKGEFEKTSDYNQRMKAWPEKVKAFEAALNAQKEEITKEAFRKYMAGYSASVLWSNYAIEKYDTENESFKLSIPVLGDVVLAVPFDNAQAFKSSGNLSFQNQDYALTESGWKLKSMEVVHSTLGTFKYDATKVKGYVAPKPVSLNLNLPSLSLGTKIQLADAPKQAPKEAVDDVDSGLPKSLTKNSNAIAIIIGIETYKDIPGVPYAKHDAETFKEYAENVLGVPGDKNHIYLITNEDATKGTFEKVFTGNGWLAKRSIPASDIYIFYAGHGAPDVSSKKAFLIPYDGDANYASQTGFSLDRLYSELKGLNARSVTVFIDACFSGGTRDNQMVLANARPMFVKIDNPVLLSEKLTVFAASSGDQISSGYPDAGHGLFSYYLFKGLKGEADANKDGTVTLDELGKYLKTTVSQKAGQLDREQTPELMTTNKDKVLVKYR
ncbi:MAG: caspase family protein [Chlorobiales bacterium]|nr:caspase family protein [Chlorobiales bacterium]